MKRRLSAPVPGPGELRIGSAVFDPRTDIPGVVAVFHDPTVRIVRPSGRTWYATRISVRPATDREKRQLRALAEHRRKQLALMGSQP